MILGFIGGLIIAWILTSFNIDKMILEVFQPFTQIELTTSFYYIGFGFLGLLCELVDIIFKKEKKNETEES